MQALYFLAPGGGRRFDLTQLEALLMKLPGAFRHPDPTELCYVIAPNAAMAKAVEDQLHRNPGTSLASQGIVTLAPTGVRIEQDAPAAVHAQLKPFVTWLMRAYACKVYSEEGEDWTARYANHPEALFLEEPV
ncbi:MAG TPA: hypothetical protein V6D47_04915 [Oscillatoriaceae cyanobacterium]